MAETTIFVLRRYSLRQGLQARVGTEAGAACRASNVCAATPVFPFDGYEPDHKGQPTTASPPADGSFLRMAKERTNIIPAPIASTLYAST
jgi:hypothetical protein